jgi:beta-glucosidase/6-phospho-beta-glucosidase/beta-galactosidase
MFSNDGVPALSCFVDSYNTIPTYVTENGLAWQEDTVEQAVNDTMRQSYLHDHIDAVGQALQAGCDVKGYFVWSFQVYKSPTNNAILMLLFAFILLFFV